MVIPLDEVCAASAKEFGNMGFRLGAAERHRPGPLPQADQAAKAGLIIRDMIQSRETFMGRVLMRFFSEREGAAAKLTRAPCMPNSG